MVFRYKRIYSGNKGNIIYKITIKIIYAQILPECFMLRSAICNKICNKPPHKATMENYGKKKSKLKPSIWRLC